VVSALGAGKFTFEVVVRVGPNSPPAGDAAFAHVGKIQPFNANNGGSAVRDGRFAHVGKPRRPFSDTEESKRERPRAQLPSDLHLRPHSRIKAARSIIAKPDTSNTSGDSTDTA